MIILTKQARFLIIGALSLFMLAKTGTAQADAWPGDTIGAGFGVQVRPEITSLDDLQRIKAAGFSYVRYDMRWRNVEHNRGEYDWDDLDHFIMKLRKYHLKSVAILDDTNPLYTKEVSVPPEEAFGASRSFAAPAKENEMRAFATFATAAVARYGTNDIIWEIWNEPDMLAFWPPAPDPEAFARLANAACLSIREVAPQAVIVGPAIARLPDQLDIFHNHFFKVFMQSPVVKCLDAISVHPYRKKDEPPETVISDYGSKVWPFIEAYTSEGQFSLPIVETEWGYTTAGHASPRQQAEYAMRIHLANLLSGVPLSILYEWKDSPPMLPESEVHFGLIDSEGKNKGGADIIDHLLPRIKDAIIMRRLPVEDESCFILLLRQPDGRYQLLAWVGRDQMTMKIVMQIKSGIHGKVDTYPLSLTPQTIDIASSMPEVTVTEKAP